MNYREDWKPVLTINAIVYGIQYLFLEPNPDDPLNKGNFLFINLFYQWFMSIVFQFCFITCILRTSIFNCAFFYL